MESLQAVMNQPIPAFPAGPPAELEQLFRDHHAGVLRAAYRITGNACDAEDVLQTVFMRLARRSPGSPPMENAAAYLHRSAVNAALDLVRDRRDSQRIPLEAQAPRLAAHEAAPDSRQEARELRDCIRRAIGRLAPRTGEIFSLHYFEGYSNSQIAGMLDLTVGGVGVTLHRARTQLQAEIRSFLGEKS
jgi:RNA polymerase sigma-70 factor (ECF subfamily)